MLKINLFTPYNIDEEYEIEITLKMKVKVI